MKISHTNTRHKEIREQGKGKVNKRKKNYVHGIVRPLPLHQQYTHYRWLHLLKANRKNQWAVVYID